MEGVIMKNKILLPIFRFGKKTVNSLFKKLDHVVCPLMWGLNWKRSSFVYQGDYIRHSSLELIAHEIYEKNINGSVAELGVYKGDFARNINTVFPDRKLYLFDTFEGFDEKDIKIDVEKKYSTGTQDFSETSIDIVLGKMKYKENCVIKKGYFPETTKNVDEKFAFVSIDVDLYEPIYNGLCYFYPRLEKGGYIFIHDYNNIGYSGTKDAIKKYSTETNVPYFPLCDGGGSAIIIK
jgi:O-methyltransferase